MSYCDKLRQRAVTSCDGPLRQKTCDSGTLVLLTKEVTWLF